jgi:hypothetical protein
MEVTTARAEQRVIRIESLRINLSMGAPFRLAETWLKMRCGSRKWIKKEGALT